MTSSLPANHGSRDLDRSFPSSLSPTSSPSPSLSFDADNKITDAPLLSRDLSSNNGHGTAKHKPRRRAAAAGKLSKAKRQQSFSRDIGHAASETYLLTRLTFTLLRYLGYLSLLNLYKGIMICVHFTIFLLLLDFTVDVPFLI